MTRVAVIRRNRHARPSYWVAFLVECPNGRIVAVPAEPERYAWHLTHSRKDVAFKAARAIPNATVEPEMWQDMPYHVTYAEPVPKAS